MDGIVIKTGAQNRRIAVVKPGEVDTYRATAHCDIANNGWVSDAVPSDNRHTVCAEIARRTNGRDTAQLMGIDAKGADVSRWLSIAVVKPELPRLYGPRIACCG